MKKLRYLKTISGGTQSLGTFTFDGALTINATATITKTLAVAADRAMQITTTTTLTSGTVRSVQINQTHTGIGAIAEALTSIITTNVALGSWANAIFAKLDFQTVGKVTGMGGVICAELTMAGGVVSQGTYATYQAEVNLPTSYSSGVPISVIRINTWGAQKADFEVNYSNFLPALEP